MLHRQVGKILILDEKTVIMTVLLMLSVLLRATVLHVLPDGTEGLTPRP